ncbi:MAG: lytic murein transglycosylase [Bdellovibrionales bacterium]
MAKITSLCLFLFALVFSAAFAQAASLRTKSGSEWLQNLQRQAMEKGISPRVVHEALDDFEPNPRVVKLDRKQPESTISFKTYRRLNITPSRINKGASLMRLYKSELAEIEKRTGVPPEIIVALWGAESNFGKNMGNFEVINSLATLAYEGRRATFFRNQLFAALYILERENMAPEELRGSWAGAMGQCQFMPSTYLNFAVDENGDGRSDIWGSTPDVLSSIANYLSAEGWRRDLIWGHEVKGGDIDSDEVGLKHSLSLNEWSLKGVREIDGSPLPQRGLRTSLLQPDGEHGYSFLVTDNIRALLRWNRSTYFVLTVGLLSNEIKQVNAN